MNKILIEAYAKINLFLEVKGKRDNGYHDIESIMMQIPLCDTVELEKTENKEEIILLSDSSECARVSDFDCLDPKDNLCCKAALSFFEASAQNNGIKIKITKRIPVKSGMAGGSADAAAVLSGMNTLFGEPFSTEELCRIAASLGADIPFCIKGGTVFCTGIGEIMKTVPSKAELHGIVTLEKDTKLSTGAAYDMVDKNTEREYRSASWLAVALINGEVHEVAKECYNIFGLSCGYSDTAAKILLKNGALNATLNGAGPSVFGIFNDIGKLQKAKAALISQGYPAFEF